MKTTHTTALALLATLGLTACGGGSGVSTGLGSGGDLSAQFATLNAGNLGAGFTPDANLLSGSATYSGIANVALGTSLSAQGAALGEMSVNVNFAGGTLSGSVSNFQYLDQTPTTGNLTFSNGTLTRNNEGGIAAGLIADATGTVAGTPMSMDVDGHFTGNGAEAIYLYMDAKSSSDTYMGVGIGVKQ